MLIKQAHLEKIKTGEISVVFRKWKKKRVNKGSLINTSIGQVEITDILEISTKEIIPKDVIASGHEELSDLIEILNKNQGLLYKIFVRYHSPDPRIALRNKSSLTSDEFEQLKIKLQRLDQYAKQGDWTLEVLNAILKNPELRSADLAIILNREKPWLKTNIRKLKNLGLTTSHEIGYSISPLGKVFLEKMRKYQ